MGFVPPPPSISREEFNTKWDAFVAEHGRNPTTAEAMAFDEAFTRWQIERERERRIQGIVVSGALALAAIVMIVIGISKLIGG